jgi:hypothetical protein
MLEELSAICRCKWQHNSLNLESPCPCFEFLGELSDFVFQFACYPGVLMTPVEEKDADAKHQIMPREEVRPGQVHVQGEVSADPNLLNGLVVDNIRLVPNHLPFSRMLSIHQRRYLL